MSEATELAKQLKPSQRGELEITDLIQIYLDQGRLDLQILADSMSMVETMTNAEAMLNASVEVQNYEKEIIKKLDLMK